MNTRDVVRRLHAFHVGRALPLGETRPYLIGPDHDCLAVAFVRMGGESRPWGIAFGTLDAEPTVLAVPDGRNRDLVAGIATQFGRALLAHLRTPGWTKEQIHEVNDLSPLRQVWLPNQTHVEMLHHLGYAYAFTTSGDANRPLLNALGRTAAWLFRESQRPGQQTVMAATDTLRLSYTFPAETSRQGHLGYLLGWLAPTGTRDSRLAAATEAERHSMSTSLDPTIERDLGDSVTRWVDITRGRQPGDPAREAHAIEQALRAELLHRIHLVHQAVSVLRQDRRRMNSGVGQLVTEAANEQWYEHIAIEQRHANPTMGTPWTPSVETDKAPAQAARRFFTNVAAAERLDSLLIHDDGELQAEAIARGDAIKGHVVRVADEGNGRSTKPVWVIEDEFGAHLRLRPGSRVCVVGCPRRTGTIRTMEETDDGRRLVTFVIENLKTAIKGGSGMELVAPNSDSWRGQPITLASASAEQISALKARRVWDQDAPGAWLTMARAGGVLATQRETAPDGDADREAS